MILAQYPVSGVWRPSSDAILHLMGETVAIIAVVNRPDVGVHHPRSASEEHQEANQQEGGADAAFIPPVEPAQPEFQPQCQAHARVA